MSQQHENSPRENASEQTLRQWIRQLEDEKALLLRQPDDDARGIREIQIRQLEMLITQYQQTILLTHVQAEQDETNAYIRSRQRLDRDASRIRNKLLMVAITALISAAVSGAVSGIAKYNTPAAAHQAEK